MIKTKISDIFVPKYRIYLFIIFLILLFICIKMPIMIPAAVAIYILTLFITYKRHLSRRERVVKYMDSLLFKLNLDQSVLNFPIPAAILNHQGEILWNNAGMDNLFRGMNKERYLENLIKELDADFDKNAPAINREINIHDKYYTLLGNVVNMRSKTRRESALMLYFVDKTDYHRLFKVYEEDKDCVGLIVIDNYEDLLQSMTDTDRPQLLAVVERILREWFSFTGGIFTKLDRDRFFIVFQRKYLKGFLDTKFEILDAIKEVNFNNKIPVTLSIGIVSGDNTQYEKFNDAVSAIDIALGRGGDQAVIKRNGKYEFFGGKSKELEKRTRVKSRVVAQALQELIQESKNVVIMGHKAMDADCLGAALGIFRLAKTLNKEAYIVFNNYGITLEHLLEKLAKEKSYDGVLIGTQEAINKMTNDTLLVVVDTHRESHVEAPEILEKTNKVVVIDHHRRGADFIQDPLLTYHEVYASSTSELVTEILQYSGEKMEITMPEAEALYAGIITDTKNFTYKTGVRTFEAAAYLKKTGIDVTEVKKMFQNDLDTYTAISDVIRDAEIIQGEIAIAICPEDIENPAQITAQAADELLNLNGIETSFVLCEMGDYVTISGRSNGSINVQVILEKLGGGGHMTIAGAQISNVTVEEARDMLLKTIQESIATRE